MQGAGVLAILHPSQPAVLAAWRRAAVGLLPLATRPPALPVSQTAACGNRGAEHDVCKLIASRTMQYASNECKRILRIPLGTFLNTSLCNLAHSKGCMLLAAPGVALSSLPELSCQLECARKSSYASISDEKHQCVPHLSRLKHE